MPDINSTYIKLNLTFNANGGSGGFGTYVDKYVTSFPQTLSITIPSRNVTRTGYNFQGWATSADSNTVDYKNGDVYTNTFYASSISNNQIIHNHTLYAVWKKKIYDVTYNHGDHSSGSNVVDTKTYNVALTLRGALFNREGKYDQVGWSIAPNGNSKDYDLKGSYTNNSNITLYPTWKSYITVSYDKGSYGTGNNTSDKKLKDIPLTLKDAIFTRTNCTQIGWSTSENGRKEYNLNGSFTSDNDNKDITLYPSWSYSIKYKKGSHGTGTEFSSTKNYGTDITLPGITFTRNNYIQAGWSTDQDGTNKDYDLNSNYTTNAPITLYPYWEETYTKCGAPTNISFTSIVKPGGSLKIEWSGASNGTNNSIDGYDVYYKIGSAPTISSYDDKASVSGTSKTFTISSAATRGAKFYAMVRTRGSAGPSYYSDWKNGNGGKVNSLPGAPTVSVDKTRIKSTGTTTVTFTVTAGSDVDTSQTKTLYYATSASGTKTSFTSPKSFNLNATTTYYFWTYDGLEFSGSYTEKTIIKNTPPSISELSMAADADITYEPSVTVSNVERKYVKKINSQATITGTNLTYEWYLQMMSGANTSPFSATREVKISKNNSINHFDITTVNGMSFNTAYRLRLKVTDDLGESAEKTSSNIFIIPPIPNITNHYNQHADDNRSGTNPAYFNSKLRIINSKNTGISKKTLFYGTSINNLNNFINLKTDQVNDVDLIDSTLIRGNTYYFKVKYECGSISGIGLDSFSYTFTNNLSDGAKISITARDGNKGIVGFFDESATIQLTIPKLVALNNNNNVSSTASNVFKNIKINNLTLRNLTYGSFNSTTHTIQITFDPSEQDWTNISTSINNYFKQINNNQPISITIADNFGNSWNISSNIVKLNFLENIQVITDNANGLYIKTTNNSQVKVPDNYNLFQSQTLIAKVKINNKIQQSLNLKLICGSLSKIVPSSTISANTQTYITLEMEIEKINTTQSGLTVKLEIYNNNNILITSAILLEGGNNKGVNLCRTNLDAVNLKITNIIENNDGNNTLTFNISCTDFGGTNSALKYSSNYATIKTPIKFYGKKNNQLGWYNFNNFGTENTIKDENGFISDYFDSSAGTGEIQMAPANGIVLGEATMFVITIIVTNNFTPIMVNNVSYTPSGTTTWTKDAADRKNIYGYTFYSKVPNLAYGKNFFILNSAENNKTDQILIIRPTAYLNNNNELITRNKIYFGQPGNETVFTIDSNGNLIIDGGTY